MTKDYLNRYLFDGVSVRGELVQLGDTYQQIISSTEYPAPVKNLLGELLVATSLLTATLKFEGSITVQVQGDGPVSLAVINGDQNQNLRGVARWEGDVKEGSSIHDLMGKGYMVITIIPTQGERYQGVVGLEGDTLAECLEAYFKNSEQLRTRIWLRTGEFEGQPKAAGMLLQVMPDGQGSESDFEHLETITDTVKNEELFGLEAQDLLYRLYHQEEVKVFEPQEVNFECGCSRERSGSAVISLHPDEIEKILAEEGKVSLHCDYCGTDYDFDSIDIAALRENATEADDNQVH
ncbi:Hsp33 family molecular chaperone HslO [Photobacterium leiognathi]|uniref:33 kDa chaperonin n=1 Tax=Photobacterium leiognathi subsp. mandapamensis TaxID=48408 RepID=A0A2T3KSU7_PHOLD|nr:Hsp33 family molecular chaperone HslO [Photobacterium leiognathi]MCG3883645.1 Hsp33 family molecular chaperone HslO [Photobacterium leiognathi]PSU99106.1 Hsp33 family molecular chaperone HslO [Photobacterium leiognathi subsp. mandapamensis]PSV09519.1 Hsp33 family molecular chaperone HslO [Photobacterium leiognathi subsp. mandapamensis]PSW42230.1 Hsp33 family molecular chaperone HslO [Photobacterium leiognathi subsp. mandapamensis]PSW55849.1 Hsp33 family molecular chaperone HslO [Photobacter